MQESIEGDINQICWGGKFISVERMDGAPITLIIKALSIRDRNFVDFIYSQAFKMAREEGVLTKFELRNELKVKGLWDIGDDSTIDTIADTVDELERKLETLPPRSMKYKRTSKMLDAYRKSLVELVNKKRMLFHTSAEDYAMDAKTSAIVYCCTYSENEERYWESWEDFEHERDTEFIDTIVREMNKVTLLPVGRIREIARSPQWRFRWQGAKGSKDLWGKPVCELDGNQQNLLYWSQIYDSVYEAYERPPEDIINDDDKLDKWLENQYKEQKNKDIADGKYVNGIQLSDGVRRHGEVFVVANSDMNPDAPDIQDIENLNTSLIKKFKQEEIKKIKQSKIINEKDLRGRKNKIARKIIGSSDAVLGKSNTGRVRGGKAADRIFPGGTIG